MKLYTLAALLLPAFVLLSEPGAPASGTDAPARSAQAFPYPSKLTYQVLWRMLTAGEAVVQLKPGSSGGWNISLDLASAGLVSRLYRVLDSYKASVNDHFCGESSVLDAQESKKRTLSRLTFDNAHHTVSYYEQDLIRKTTANEELDIPPCTFEITGALASLRLLNLPPGKSIILPITDGKKLAQVRVEAQAREKIQVGGKTYSTTRYEALLFDNVLYKRKGRLFVWMTDDPERLPVQFRIQLGFPIGNILVELEKQEKL
jgi:hypothetical protein